MIDIIKFVLLLFAGVAAIVTALVIGINFFMGYQYGDQDFHILALAVPAILLALSIFVLKKLINIFSKKTKST